MISVIDRPPNSGWEARRWEGASRVRMVGRGWRPRTFAKPHQCACPSAQKGAPRLLLRCRRPPASIDASIPSYPSACEALRRATLHPVLICHGWPSELCRLETMHRTSLESLARELSNDVWVDMAQTKSRGRGKPQKSNSRKKHRVLL